MDKYKGKGRAPLVLFSRAWERAGRLGASQGGWLFARRGCSFTSVKCFLGTARSAASAWIPVLILPAFQGFRGAGEGFLGAAIWTSGDVGGFVRGQWLKN